MEDVIFDVDAEGCRIIKGATLPILIEAVISPNQHKMMYELLLTYRSFCTPIQLLNQLMTFFKEPPGVDPNDEKEKNVVQFRISAVLKRWTGEYWFDFKGDNELLETLINFLETCVKPRHRTLAQGLIDRVTTSVKNDKSTKALKLHLTGSAPDPIEPKLSPNGTFVISETHPLEVARQLTLIEYNLYKNIRPSECLNNSWNKDGKEVNSPNIIAMIQRFNEVSNWVATEILSPTKEKLRTKTYCWFLDLAECCKQLNNFNALLEIISGLNQGPVHRLKDTWTLPHKYNILFDNLNKLVSRDNNHKILREYISNVSPPCVPYLGIYLTDLTFVAEGNKDFIGDNKLINFVKRRRYAHVIQDMTKYQLIPYVLQMVPVLLKYLKKLEYLNENVLYQLSESIKPRGQ
eukprot:TRINITY_DN11168_c0_g1_i1.p1 TRINITY_DN11168_c0_g1~~TRINITY_DN11168_c0_g1_i1.p1  ORF type:complete len:471 (-),score=56.73 TRINITY_DN11168_c0_g1_i1:49-1263(-)